MQQVNAELEICLNYCNAGQSSNDTYKRKRYDNFFDALADAGFEFTPISERGWTIMDFIGGVLRDLKLRNVHVNASTTTATELFVSLCNIMKQKASEVKQKTSK